MKVTYLCPHCRGAINAGNNIILYGERITFKVDEKKQVESYEEKLSRFIDPEWFLSL